MLWVIVFIICVLLSISPLRKSFQLEGHEGTMGGRVATWFFCLALGLMLLFALAGLMF